MTSRLLIALMVAALVAGCDNDPSTPTTPTPPRLESPVTNSFTNRLPQGGGVARTFTTSASGDISVTLKSTTPESKVGLGIGIPFNPSAFGSCTLTVSVETSGSATPQIAMPAAAATYCVVVWDLGTLAGPIDFDATIIYP